MSSESKSIQSLAVLSLLSLVKSLLRQPRQAVPTRSKKIASCVGIILNCMPLHGLVKVQNLDHEQEQEQASTSTAKVTTSLSIHHTDTDLC